jgi:hypothetical protein
MSTYGGTAQSSIGLPEIGGKPVGLAVPANNPSTLRSFTCGPP